MARPRRHRYLGCDGVIKAVYLKDGNDAKLRSVGSLCLGCQTFVPHEEPMQQIPDLKIPDPVPGWRTAISAIKDDVTRLCPERVVYEGFGEIVRGRPELLRSYNPFLAYVQRWYATSAVMAIRRQTDSESRGASLRSLLEDIAEKAAQYDYATYLELYRQRGYDDEMSDNLARGFWKEVGSGERLDASKVRADLAALDELASDVRRHANREIVHQSKNLESDFKLTFNDLHLCIDGIERLTKKYVALLTGASYVTLVPVDMTDWTQIFAFAWRGTSNDVDAPYKVGDDGVPYDALPPRREYAVTQPCLAVSFERPIKRAAGVFLGYVVSNIGVGAARRVRMFLPCMNNVACEEPIGPGNAIAGEFRYDTSRAFTEHMKPPCQVVVEYEDVNGNLYRQYANVRQPMHGDIQGFSTDEFGIPYRVSKRTVQEPDFAA